jgi:hypothetical protein
VAGEDGHPDARAGDQQVGETEDLAALVAELLLPSVSLLPSSTNEPACGITLNAIGFGKTFDSGNSTAEPSWVSSVARSATFLICSSSSATPASPAPPTAWYVVAMKETRPASSCSGRSTGIAAIVVQLGLAMMPFGRTRAASGLTSATTSGTSGSIRYADELSTMTAPASAKRGANSFEPPLPAEKSTMSRPE